MQKALSLEPFPDHELSLTLRAKAEIDPPALGVKCTAPIYRSFALYREGGDSELIMVPGPVRRRGDEVFFAFGGHPLPVGTVFLIKIFSPVPISLKRAGLARVR